MTNKTLEKAKDIERQIDDLRKLKIAANKSYLKICSIRRSRNNLAIQDGNNVIIAEQGLNDVIIAFCDKRIEELKSDLEAL